VKDDDVLMLAMNERCSSCRFVQGACNTADAPDIDFVLQDGQCVLTLGGETHGFLAALGAEVVLSNIVVSRSPRDASEPTISATDSTLLMDTASIIIIDPESFATAQGLRLRGSRALLSGVHSCHTRNNGCMSRCKDWHKEDVLLYVCICCLCAQTSRQ
jgi:hypothetical protein